MWGNPLLRDARGLGLEHTVAQDLCHARVLATVGDLVRAMDALMQQGVKALVDRVWGMPMSLPPFLRDEALMRERLDALWACVPVPWLLAARRVERMGAANRAAAGVPDTAAVESMIVARLGWAVPGSDTAVPLSRASVKLLTLLQLDALSVRRADLHAAYVAEALGPGAAATEATLAFRVVTLPRLWRVRWENVHKEVLWRLAVDGVPLLGNCHVGQQPAACVCGFDVGASPRLHHFWACPIAAAVVAAVGSAGGAAVTRASLWLAVCPAGLLQPVWDVVCLAALSAMEHGRRYAKAGGRAHGDGASLLQRACVAAVADFWGRLSGFVALGRLPDAWAVVPADHPFVGRAASGAPRLNKP